MPPSKTGAELLSEIFSQHYERASVLVTNNLTFDECTEVFGPERFTGALLDRLTHHVHIMEMNGDSYHLKQGRRKRRPPANRRTLSAPVVSIHFIIDTLLIILYTPFIYHVLHAFSEGILPFDDGNEINLYVSYRSNGNLARSKMQYVPAYNFLIWRPFNGTRKH